MEVKELAQQLAQTMREALSQTQDHFATIVAQLNEQIHEIRERQTDVVTMDSVHEAIGKSVESFPMARMAELAEQIATLNENQATFATRHELAAIVLPKGDKGEDGISIKGDKGEDGVSIKGDKGEDGRDALELQVHGSIDPTKSYPRGHYASHMGGLWRSVRKTDHLKGAPAECGWELLVDGVASVEFEQTDERNLTIRSIQASGTVKELPIYLPVPVYRGVYSGDSLYLKNDCATFGGSIWMALEDTQTKPGTGPEWKLAVKAGRDGRREG